MEGEKCVLVFPKIPNSLQTGPNRHKELQIQMGPQVARSYISGDAAYYIIIIISLNSRSRSHTIPEPSPNRARPGPDRLGSYRLGSGSARPGPARLGSARPGSARLGFAPPLAPPGAKKVSKLKKIVAKTVVFVKKQHNSL